MPDGKSISIQPFDTTGVRKIGFEEQENTEDYDIICVPATSVQIETVERFFHDTKGDAYALRLAGAVDNLYHYSDLTPQRLYEVLKKYAD